MHEDHFWRALCQQLGMPEHSGLSAQARTEDAPELRHAIERAVRTRTSADLLASLAPAGVPVGLVNTPGTVADDPLFRERGMIVGTGRSTRVRSPISRTAPPQPSASPALGGDSRELLIECGYSDMEIDQLLGSGIVSQH